LREDQHCQAFTNVKLLFKIIKSFYKKNPVILLTGFTFTIIILLYVHYKDFEIANIFLSFFLNHWVKKRPTNNSAHQVLNNKREINKNTNICKLTGIRK